MKNHVAATLEAPSAGHALVGSSAAGWAEPQPACWRSEAFAEDLPDTGALAFQGAGMPASRREQLPMLRRALSVVLGR